MVEVDNYNRNERRNINVKAFYLTTVDNPFDPAEQFEDWYRFDMDHGYCTSELLMRIAIQSNQLTESENEHEIEVAIDKILAIDFLHQYKKVVKEIEDPN